MDDIVKRALAKWPNVPSCTGWLMLDRRGIWRMRDEAVQAAGTSGTPITHTALKGFINRNYAVDERGQWYFQNGPQRVFIELAYTPWIVRLHAGQSDDSTVAPRLIDHTDQPFEPVCCWLDDRGSVLFSDASTAPRIALLHDHDLDLFTNYLVTDEAAADGTTLQWGPRLKLPVSQIAAHDVARRFGFVPSPAAAQATGNG